MTDISIIPGFVTTFFRGMPQLFRYRHRSVLIWYVLMLAIGACDGRLTSLTTYGPSYFVEWRLRRLLNANYWDAHQLFQWLIKQVIKVLSSPEDGVLYLIVDGSKKDKRTKQHPYGQKGRSRKKGNWFFGIRFCVLMAQWGNYRIPVDFQLLYPTTHKKHATENQVFIKMLERFEPPQWCKQVIVLGDCAFSSRKNMVWFQKKLVDTLKKGESPWYFCMALAKTNRFKNGKQLKNLCQSLKKSLYRKTYIASINNQRKRCYWTHIQSVRLKHAGDVTILLSKKGYNLGPKQVKVIVTNLPQTTARQILSIYQRRFMIEVLFRELKSHLGFGKQQVTKSESRIEKSIYGSFLAYLLLIRMQHTDIKPGCSWSIQGLQQQFKIRWIRFQKNHDIHLIRKSLLKAP